MRVQFFDTESTDLHAIMGRILCASFAPLSGSEKAYTLRGDRAPYRGKTLIDDRALCIGIREELETADMVVTWNGILHDIPLLNARLALHGERGVHIQRHVDLMYYSRGASMKVGSSKLDNVARFFKCPHQKTPLDWEVWQLAGTGDKGAMGNVVIHCEADVLVLRDLWPHLAPYVKKYQMPLSSWFRWATEIRT